MSGQKKGNIFMNLLPDNTNKRIKQHKKPQNTVNIISRKTLQTDKAYSKHNYINKKRETQKLILPKHIEIQQNLCKKYDYKYNIIGNGNVENNSTIYLITGVAHYEQIYNILNNALETVKKMPKIFGEDFNSDIIVNLVRSVTGQYLGYAFADVSNPAFYNVLVGLNPDGSDRSILIDDPDWEIPETDDININYNDSWANIVDLEDMKHPTCPKIRKELEPIITFNKFAYDNIQKEHLCTEDKYGTISVSPAYITPGKFTKLSSNTLFVGNLPLSDEKNILDFLYGLFSRYARTKTYSDYKYYPNINIKNDRNGRMFALIHYAHMYDAYFALIMLKKIHIVFQNENISLSCKFAEEIIPR